MYQLREGRDMSPECFKTVVSNLLYERRFDILILHKIN